MADEEQEPREDEVKANEEEQPTSNEPEKTEETVPEPQVTGDVDEDALTTDPPVAPSGEAGVELPPATEDAAVDVDVAPVDEAAAEAAPSSEATEKPSTNDLPQKKPSEETADETAAVDEMAAASETTVAGETAAADDTGGADEITTSAGGGEGAEGEVVEGAEMEGGEGVAEGAVDGETAEGAAEGAAPTDETADVMEDKKAEGDEVKDEEDAKVPVEGEEGTAEEVKDVAEAVEKEDGEVGEKAEGEEEEGDDGEMKDQEAGGEKTPKDATPPDSTVPKTPNDFFDVDDLEERELMSPPRAGSPTPEVLQSSTTLTRSASQVVPQYDREQLIDRYNHAISEQHELREKNHQHQHKLAEYFRRKKPEEARPDVGKNTSDQDQRYIKYMSNLDELRSHRQIQSENYSLEIADLKERCDERQAHVDEARQRYITFKRNVAANSVFSRSGKVLQERDSELHLQNEEKKEAEVVSVRLEFIKLKNNLKKKEQQLKSKEELAEGLHLIDFEQLKIENQTYNEKIEERNEELMKLRKKITSTVQVLTHLKEKLQFVQAESHVQKRKLHAVEQEVAQKRDMLSRTKQSRDSLRIDNHKLRQNCGLLGNMSLLRDYEERKDEGDMLRSQIEKLSMMHAELTLNLNGVRRKINQAKAATGT